MIGGIGYAYHHRKRKYQAQFREPTPDWLQCLPVNGQFRLLGVSLALKWKLPQEHFVEHTQCSAKGDANDKA